MKDKDAVTGHVKDGTCLASYILIGALSFPLILITTLVLGYSVLTSFLIAVLLAMPVSIGAVFVLRLISHR